jgi:hypothetical protein
VRSGHVLTLVQERGKLAVVPLVRDEREGVEDSLELRGRCSTSLVADRREVLEMADRHTQ